MTRNPDDIDMRLIADWRKQGSANPPSAEKLAEVLAYILIYHENYGEGDEVPVHVDLLDLIGRYFDGTAAWTKLQAKARTEFATARRADWNKQAKAIRAHHPDWRDSDVARQIRKQLRGSDQDKPKLDTIRKAIRK